MNENIEQKKIGSRMLWIFWLLLIGGLAMFFGNWQEKQYNPTQVLLGMSALKQLDFNQSGDVLTLTQYLN